MTAESRTFPSADELGLAAAELIIEGIRGASIEARRYLLGCPGGRSPRPIYQALGRRAASNGIDCSHVMIVMMDDYLDMNASSPALVAAEAHYSCRGFAEHEIRQVVNRGLEPGHRISSDAIWLPDPVDPADYDKRLAGAGGIDLFLVASGASDGHVAFNGPGADVEGETSLVALAMTTRDDNMTTFPQFERLGDVPTRGVSVGLGTIRDLSHSVLLVLHGADKQRSARRVAAGRYEADWPATFIHQCPDAHVWMDALASDGMV